MEAIITKQYSFRNQPFYDLVGTTVGLVDSDFQSLSFYTQKLKQANLEVVGFETLPDLSEQVLVLPISAVIFSPQVDKFSSELNALSQFIAKNPQLPLITMAKTMQEMQIDAIMRLGARLHINRDLSQPRDLLIALQQVMK